MKADLPLHKLAEATIFADAHPGAVEVVVTGADTVLRIGPIDPEYAREVGARFLRAAERAEEIRRQNDVDAARRAAFADRP